MSAKNLYFARLAVDVAEAGLQGARMPDVGPYLTPDWIEILNAIYVNALKRGRRSAPSDAGV